MARCYESVDVLSKMTSNDIEIHIIESSDSESENESTSNSNPDVNEEKDYNYDSLENADNERLQVNVGPVLSLKCLHEEEEEDNTDGPVHEESVENEKHPHHLPVKIVAVNGSSSAANSEISNPSSLIPAKNNWEGAYNFKIKVQCTGSPKKSESTIFSEMHQKLYVLKDQPFKVLVYAENVPKGSRINVAAIFAMDEHSFEVLQRCPTHSQADFAKGNPAYEHFVQCTSEAAVYEKNVDNGKLSVSVPYEKPQEGEDYTTYLFKLTCFSSCSGGINRRPFVLVFTLEKDNSPLGRQTIETKVCACPVRDFKVDEDRDYRKKSRKNSVTKTMFEEETAKKKYTITVKDPDLYMFLEQMKCLYEVCAYSSKVVPDEK